MRPLARALVTLVVLAGAAVPEPSGAQRAHSSDPRLERLDATTRASVAVVLDSARAARLPLEPLVDRALEGQGKGVDGARIVVAVRQLEADLQLAREALGASTRSDEIAAGANALHAGMTPGDLARVRAAARSCGRRRVTMPLALAADLIARAVPAPAAAELVVRLTGSGLRDPDLATYERNVRLDIERGADPTTSAQTRARGALLRVQPPGNGTQSQL
ncbi:MAG TPA: hypothetical protein VJU87_01785 [Gemmatimonadaceae bacterium]|nr:hypothetical protein [Gemmatimonadaceae bacterium]